MLKSAIYRRQLQNTGSKQENESLVERCPTRFGTLGWKTESLSDRQWFVTLYLYDRNQGSMIFLEAPGFFRSGLSPNVFEMGVKHREEK